MVGICKLFKTRQKKGIRSRMFKLVQSTILFVLAKRNHFHICPAHLIGSGRAAP